MRTIKSKFKKTKASLVLLALVTVQISAAIELCMCQNESTSTSAASALENDLHPCHGSSPSSENMPIQKHDHSGCDCEIDAPDDEQTLNTIPAFDFQQEVYLYALIEKEVINKMAASFSLSDSPPGASAPPLYKITQRYLN